VHFAFLWSIQTIVTERHSNCDFDFNVLCIIMGWCRRTSLLRTFFYQRGSAVITKSELFLNLFININSVF